ncbi:MAG: DUF6163 family protein [Pseudolabrys sp.]|jgi:fatty acid desaturase
MTDPVYDDQSTGLEPVQEREGEAVTGRWTRRLIIFLRLMAVLSMAKGIYHWSRLLGIGVSHAEMFEAHSVAWQAATVFFAVIDLVAAVGLWLATAWGAVIWLTAVTSMIALDVFFAQVFGVGPVLDIVEGALLLIYLVLALMSAQEQPS